MKWYWLLPCVLCVIGLLSCEKKDGKTQTPTAPENSAPAAVTAVAPADSFLCRADTLTLSWSCNDPDNDPLTYAVYLDTVNPPQRKMMDSTVTSFHASGLQYKARYFWSIIATDGQDSSIGGPWEFTTDVPVEYISLGNILPALGEVDSCLFNGYVEAYDTTNFNDKIDGFDLFFYDKGFIRCVWRSYTYQNELFYHNPNFDPEDRPFNIFLDEMANADSARSLFASSIEYSDTACVLDTLGDEAIIIQGSWNLGCYMRKGRYFVKFDGISYSDTTQGGDREILKNKYIEFLSVINQKIQ
ncbi:MAG: hypothetical protein A2350_16130 [Candidatus Raymondbacteria bacterium RifOxyB12_full_50_8]|uniref:Fibronectin type-III domain-containing protein n=1 Tax=Candidatus Raymondbacteria bacterium RIFOXYD12_FULL_49_13 TaxID=1817890 RepID=A0A1F7F661_UNCRA|nr:MAG: hypothetical protein A2248_03475 [Candidatus Raymondbacteria bacterium RIFOXYA2_FULL_49_16]OGJ99638.1 MAG: hypothetical protein A2350_16130 [Candidatus Raymondbacteria bacterium RifOxyB12_full_50_8]OGK02129.1 MAG: hypothetical protein A2519_18890 [Candidatus Raymondbacteria bacterium RIFOXYD12_FULL_49_13]OGP42514.1 MAG: hypothetical protein A2324_17510 [Candidatus Raymondbacteria bacterium RIFOXYB2_FULL_49_35]